MCEVTRGASHARVTSKNKTVGEVDLSISQLFRSKLLFLRRTRKRITVCAAGGQINALWKVHSHCRIFLSKLGKTIHLIQKWPPLGKKLARVARKRGHKGQFGWNKNKKVNQLTLRHNCHFSSLSNSFTLPQNMQNSRETTLGPYELVFVQLAPV